MRLAAVTKGLGGERGGGKGVRLLKGCKAIAERTEFRCSTGTVVSSNAFAELLGEISNVLDTEK